MRICFIADSSSIHVRRIISFYVGEKDEILVLSSAQEVSDIPGTKTVHLLAGNELSSALSFPLRVANKSWHLRWNIFLLRLLRKRAFCVEQIQGFDPDVIYCWRSFPEGILASHCAIRPLLLRTAGPDISKLPKYPVYKQIIRKALRSADVIVTEAHWEKQLVRDLCGARAKVEANTIGVNTNLFRPTASRNNLRDKYGLSREAFVVVSNRDLGGHYNGWLVVKAIQSIMDKCPDLELFYINPSKLGLRTKPKVEAVVRRFPRIRFIDGGVPHSEVPDILGCGDVYISFSSYDGTPYSLLEAMACGLIPIVAELPQLHEFMEQGVSGYFVPQHDINSLASVVCNLYKDRQTIPAMSARCVSKIQEEALYEVCSERIRDLLKNLGHADRTEKTI